MKILHELLRNANQVRTILWSKLKLWHYGIRGTATDWIKSHKENVMHLNWWEPAWPILEFQKGQFLVLWFSFFTKMIYTILLDFPLLFKFVDDAGLLNIEDSLCVIDKLWIKILENFPFGLMLIKFQSM